jgi:hypothetical protein
MGQQSLSLIRAVAVAVVVVVVVVAEVEVEESEFRTTNEPAQLIVARTDRG